MTSKQKYHQKGVNFIYENNFSKAKAIFEKYKDVDIFAYFYLYICEINLNQTSFKNQNKIGLEYIKLIKKNFKKYEIALSTDSSDEVKYILGHLYSLKRMGKYYNYDKAFKLLQRAAKNGYAPAQVRYSQLIRDESLNREDIDASQKENLRKSAILNLKKAAAQNYGMADYLLAECYSYGHLNTKINKDTAMKYYKEGAKHKVFLCNTDIASRILENPNIKDKKEAFEYLSVASKYKYPRSDRFLSICYFHGFGCEKNIKKAIFYAKRSLKNNHIQSALILYNIYHELGNQKLAKKYGRIYFEDLIYLKNNSHMRMFYYEHMGSCFLNGIGTKKNTLKAIEYYKKGANCSYTYCMVKLANIYLDENTKYHNTTLAIKYLKMASEKNDTEATYRLGDYYKDDKKINEAKKYFKIGADNDDCLSMYALGMLYSRENKLRLALDFLQKALNYGIEQAKYEIDRINFTQIAKINNIKELTKEDIVLINKKMFSNNIKGQVKSTVDTTLEIYLKLKDLSSNPSILVDYSPVITLLSKAIEIEFKKYFKNEFTNYLINKNVMPHEIAKFSKNLTIEIDKKYNKYIYDVNDENSFTMGDIIYTLCISKYPETVQYDAIDYKYSLPSTDSVNKRYIFHNKYFIDFLDSIFKRDAFSLTNRREELLQYLLNLQHDLYFFKDYLRNSAVHSSIMSIYDANLAINLIILSQDMLFKFKDKLEENYK